MRIDNSIRELENKKKLNSLLQYYIENGIPLKVVKCQYENKKKSRFGRFNLNKKTHRFLRKYNGYYIFLVEKDNKLIKGKVIFSGDITFKTLICWKILIE